MENINPHDRPTLAGGDITVLEHGAAVLLVMCEPVRLAILSLLAERELPIRHLIAEVGSDGCSLFQHLAVLKKAGLITTRRRRETYYSCRDSKVLGILKILRDEFGYRHPAGTSSPTGTH